MCCENRGIGESDVSHRESDEGNFIEVQYRVDLCRLCEVQERERSNEEVVVSTCFVGEKLWRVREHDALM